MFRRSLVVLMGKPQMIRINRAVIVVRPAQPCLDWVNGLSPDARIGPEDVAQDNTVYLVPEFVTLEEAAEYLKPHARIIFERELSDWHEDPKAWPKPRNWEMLRKWFTLEVHSAVVDLADEAIEAVDGE